MVIIFSKIWKRLRLPVLITKDHLLGDFKPRVVVLVVNNPCNMRCKYCFGDYYKRSGADDFNTEELMRLIDDLYNNGTVYITMHGGETLLRKDIGLIVEYIKKKGMCVNLITNGTLLSDKIEEIKMVDGICVSLDGKKENNDINRGRGAFDMAIKAIRQIKQYRIPLRVSATLTRHTMGDIPYLAQLARELKFHLLFSIIFPTTPQIASLCMSDSEIRESVKIIIQLKKQGFPIFSSIEALNYALNWPVNFSKIMLRKVELPKGMKPIPCCYSRHKFTIDANGRAFPCFPLMNDFPSLNVKEVGVKKAFRHVAENTDCVACPFLTQNDWSFMMTLNPKILLKQIPLHLKELLWRY